MSTDTHAESVDIPLSTRYVYAMSTPRQYAALSVSVAEAADITSFSAFDIWNAVSTGQLPAIRLGDRAAIRVTDLERWLDSLPAVNDPS